jgi:signal transduction histidine kinase/ActR/RegA family two-component response regulator
MNTPTSKRHEWQQETERTLSALLLSQAPSLLLASLIVAITVCATLWRESEPERVLVWLTSIALITLGRYLMVRHIRDRPSLRSSRIYALATLPAGIVWGLSFIAFPQTAGSFYLLMIILAGLSASSLFPLSAHRPTYLMFMIPVTGAGTIAALLNSTSDTRSVGFLTLIFLLTQFGYSKRLNTQLRQTLYTQFENVDLVENLIIERLKSERALSLKSRVLAAASHDLRQPTHAQSLLVGVLKRLLRNHQALPAAFADVAEKMQSAVTAQTSLLDELLDIARIESGQMTINKKPLALTGILDDLRKQYSGAAEAKGLYCKICPTSLWVDSDHDLLRRMLGNLLDNAIRYTQKGGVLLGARRDGDGSRVRICVIDTGAGIAESAQLTIFEEFAQLENPERSRHKGLGLGLAILRQLADRLGHVIDLRSVVGRGSNFAVCVDRARPQMNARVDANVTAELSESSWLVIDDDELSLSATVAAMQSLGLNVRSTSNAEDALELAKSHRFDGALSDLRLDGPQNGIELLAAINQQQPGIARLLMTGDTSPERLVMIRESGISMLHKPIAIDSLKQLLAQLLQAQ